VGKAVRSRAIGRWLMPVRKTGPSRRRSMLNQPMNAHPYRQALNYAALGDKERAFEAPRAPLSSPRSEPRRPGTRRWRCLRRPETEQLQAIQPSMNFQSKRSGQSGDMGETMVNGRRKMRLMTRSRSAQD
jgi:hypothetical protein